MMDRDVLRGWKLQRALAMNALVCRLAEVVTTMTDAFVRYIVTTGYLMVDDLRWTAEYYCALPVELRLTRSRVRFRTDRRSY